MWEIPAKISAVILRISQEEMIISNIKKLSKYWEYLQKHNYNIEEGWMCDGGDPLDPSLSDMPAMHCNLFLSIYISWYNFSLLFNIFLLKSKHQMIFRNLTWVWCKFQLHISQIYLWRTNLNNNGEDNFWSVRTS